MIGLRFEMILPGGAIILQEYTTIPMLLRPTRMSD